MADEHKFTPGHKKVDKSYETLDDLKEDTMKAKAASFDVLMESSQYLLIAVRDDETHTHSAVDLHGRLEDLFTALAKWLIKNDYDEAFAKVIIREHIIKVAKEIGELPDDLLP